MQGGHAGIQTFLTAQAKYGSAINEDTDDSEQYHARGIGGFRMEEARDGTGKHKHAANDQNDRIDQSSQQRITPVAVAVFVVIAAVRDLCQVPGQTQ